jgi:hypothetical protein
MKSALLDAIYVACNPLTNSPVLTSDFIRAIFLAHTHAFLDGPSVPADPVFMFVRNSLPAAIRNATVTPSLTLPNKTANEASAEMAAEGISIVKGSQLSIVTPTKRTFDDYFREGKLGWFHTSSEIEPRGVPGKFTDATQVRAASTDFVSFSMPSVFHFTCPLSCTPPLTVPDFPRLLQDGAHPMLRRAMGRVMGLAR